MTHEHLYLLSGYILICFISIYLSYKYTVCNFKAYLNNMYETYLDYAKTALPIWILISLIPLINIIVAWRMYVEIKFLKTKVNNKED